MSILTEAAADIKSYALEIDGWETNFLELLENVYELDLVFQQAQNISINFLGFCRWDDPTEIVVIETIPPSQTAEQHKRTLARTSVITTLLHDLGHFDVAAVLLADSEGVAFKHEGFIGRARPIAGCSRAGIPKSEFGFSAIPGHIEQRGPCSALN